jgi:K+-transporting ATPase ATPase C chain
MFPSAVTQTGADGKPQTSIQPVKEGSDIQSTFFDIWRQEHRMRTFRMFRLIW